MVKSGGFTATRASIMAKQKTAASNQRVSIPARHAKAALVKKGRRIKVINTHGTQVVDCWALNPDNLGEYMSLEHCWGITGSGITGSGLTIDTAVLEDCEM